jgi:hypothetical protein
MPGGQTQRPRLPITRQRAIDQPRVQVLGRVVSETEPVQDTGPVAFEQNIGALHQGLKLRPAGVGFKIKTGHRLAGVEHVIEG